MQGRHISQQEKEKLQRMVEQGSTAGIDLTQASKPVQSNEARLSLVLGFLSLGSVLIISVFGSAFWLPGIAILLGVRGLYTISKKGRTLQFTGKGPAIAGILLGVLSYMILVLVLIGIFTRIRS